MFLPAIKKSTESSGLKFCFDPEFVSCKFSTYSPEKNALSELSTGATTIFLQHYCVRGETRSYPSKSKVSLKNDCGTTILNLTLFSREDRKEVLFLTELAPGKTVPLTFIKKNVYEMRFWTAHAPTPAHSSLKIFESSSPTSSRPNNLNFNLKPTWLR